MIQAAATLSRDVGKKAACEAMEVSRATFYRHLSQHFQGSTTYLIFV
jgi:predicted DNA-binding protein (UPF0251 family)